VTYGKQKEKEKEEVGAGQDEPHCANFALSGGFRSGK
jgi:hypothetical protein